MGDRVLIVHRQDGDRPEWVSARAYDPDVHVLWVDRADDSRDEPEFVDELPEYERDDDR